MTQQRKESRIPVLREVALNYSGRQKRPRAFDSKAQLRSANEVICLEEQLRHSECERGKLAQAFETLSKELARCKNDNKQLVAKIEIATYIKDDRKGSALSYSEQEEDLLIAQLVERVITSQQRALLTQGLGGDVTGPVHRGAECAEGNCTEPCSLTCTRHDTNIAQKHGQASQLNPLSNCPAMALQTGSEVIASATIATYKEELDSLKARLSAELEKNAEQNVVLEMYQKRYHQCLEHCDVLESQVRSHCSLLGKVEAAVVLKEKALALLKENTESIDHHMSQLSADRETWSRQLASLSQKVDDLTKECTELRALRDGSKHDSEQLLKACAHYLASCSIQRALVLSLREEVERLRADLSCKVVEASDTKRKLAQYHSLFKRSQLEYQETLEFSDAERSSLLQSIKEMESQVQTLQQQLRGKEAVIATLKAAEVNARELRMSLQLSQVKNSMFDELEVSVRGAYQLFRGLLVTIGGTDKMSRHPENSNEIESGSLGRHLMSVGIDLQRRLQHTNLPDSQGSRGEMCYEDLLRENLCFNERITELTHELEKEVEQSKRVQQYSEQYQSSASCKIAVLKENLAKADLEIAELDKLVDHMREVMHGDLDLIKRSPQLLDLLRELDGNEAPQNY